MEFTYNGEEMFLQVRTYPNGAKRIDVISNTEGPYAALCKPSFPQYENGDIVINDSYEEQKNLVGNIVKCGILEHTGKAWLSGFSEYGVYKFTERYREV